MVRGPGVGRVRLQRIRIGKVRDRGGGAVHDTVQVRTGRVRAVDLVAGLHLAITFSPARWIGRGQQFLEGRPAAASSPVEAASSPVSMT